MAHVAKAECKSKTIVATSKFLGKSLLCGLRSGPPRRQREPRTNNACCSNATCVRGRVVMSTASPGCYERMRCSACCPGHSGISDVRPSEHSSRGRHDLVAMRHSVDADRSESPTRVRVLQPLAGHRVAISFRPGARARRRSRHQDDELRRPESLFDICSARRPAERRRVNVIWTRALGTPAVQRNGRAIRNNARTSKSPGTS